MSPKAVNFKSKEGYRKWLAFGHIHKKFHGKQKVTIRGKPHTVKHTAKRGH
jgi:hypothetical protein